MPPNEGLGPDNCENRQDRRKPAIQLDKEPAVVIREPDPTAHFAPQNDQLMSERCVLGLKPALRLEWRRQNGQSETHQCDHDALTLGDSFGQSIRMRFLVHTVLASNVRILSRLNGLIERNKFLSEAFEDRIDRRRKQSVIACFELRDLGPQSFHTFAVH